MFLNVFPIYLPCLRPLGRTVIMSSIRAHHDTDKRTRVGLRNIASPSMLPQFLWALVISFLFASLPPTRAQTVTTLTLSLDTPVTLSGKNFSTTSSPVLFSLPPSSSEITISLALCAAASSNPPLVFVSNSSDSQVVPGPNGGADAFGVQIGSLGLGNFILELSSGSTAGLLAVYGGSSSDSLEIGVTQGSKYSRHVLMFAQLTCLYVPPFLSDATSCASPRPALLWGLDRQRSPPLLPSLPPPIACTATGVPELHTSAGEHLAPLDSFAEQPQLHRLPRAALCRTRRAPADRVCHPRWRHEQCSGGTECKGGRGAALAA